MGKINKFVQGIFSNPTRFLVDGTPKEIVPSFGTQIQAPSLYTPEVFNSITQQGVYSVIDTSNTVNQMAVNLEGISDADFTNDLKVLVTPNLSNTGACTIAFAGSLTKSIKLGTNALQQGDIVAKRPCVLVFDVANDCFQLCNQSYTKTITDAINSLNSSIASKEPLSFKGTITVDNTSWVSGSYGGGMAYRKTVPISGVTATDTVGFYPTLATKQIAQVANVSHIESYTGGVYLYSESIPSGSITFDYRVIRG